MPIASYQTSIKQEVKVTVAKVLNRVGNYCGFAYEWES